MVDARMTSLGNPNLFNPMHVRGMSIPNPVVM